MRYRIIHRERLLPYVFSEDSHAIAMVAKLTIDHIKGIKPDYPYIAATWKNASWERRFQIADEASKMKLYRVIEETLDLPVTEGE